VNLPDYSIKDVQETNLSNDGKLFMRSNLGGDFRAYQITEDNGVIVKNFTRIQNVGQYYIRSSFSAHNNWLVLNSAIGQNSFAGDIGTIEVFTKDGLNFRCGSETKLRSFMSWPSIYAFSSDENTLAYTNTGTNIIFYDLIRQTIIKEISLTDVKYYMTNLTFSLDGSMIARLMVRGLS
jgi:hypothetical protein